MTPGGDLDSGSRLYAADAEFALLSEVMYRPAVIRETSSVVAPEDFGNHRYRQVYSLIAGLVSASENPASVTPLTVRAEVKTRRDEQERNPEGTKWPVKWLDDGELADVMTSSSGGHWQHAARLVVQAATRRRTVEAAQRTITEAMHAEGDPTLLAQAATDRFAEIRDSHIPPGRLQTRTLREVFDTEDDPYDWVIPQLLEHGDRLVLTGEEGAGKALDVETPIPTPAGWRRMGDLQVGDYVFGPDGIPTRIVAATDVLYDRPCYRVEFSDGSHLVADESHLWLTEDYYARQAAGKASRRSAVTKPHGTDQRWKRTGFPKVVTTRQIAETLTARGGFCLNHSIPTCEPLRFPEADLPVHPYVLGAWLGDGHSAGSRLTCADKPIIDQIALHEPVRKGAGEHLWSISDGHGLERARGLVARLRALGVLDNKHIPDLYATASVEQRLELLRGLMDTDGTVTARASTHHCEHTSTSERLAEGVLALCLSLGIKATMAKGVATLNGVEIGPKWRIHFTTDLRVFHLPRKADRQVRPATRRAAMRYIKRADPISSVPVRCIQVARPDGLYVAGRECIITHNSTFARQVAICAAAGIHPFALTPIPPVKVVVVDAENSERQWRRKARSVAVAAARGGSVDPRDAVHLVCVGGMDLTGAADVAALHRLIDEHEPDLMIVGPLYRMVPKEITNDTDAAPLIAALNSLRDRGPALIMEAHMGHGKSGSGRRDPRPRGSSALLGWPEFGYGILKDADNPEVSVDLVRWREDRDERPWPKTLIRGGAFPWTDERVPLARRRAFAVGGAAANDGWSPADVLEGDPDREMESVR